MVDSLIEQSLDNWSRSPCLKESLSRVSFLFPVSICHVPAMSPAPLFAVLRTVLVVAFSNCIGVRG